MPITKMPLPRSVNELQRFLGMANYLEKFIPNLAEHSTPLRNLLKKDIIFELQKPPLDAFENLKTLITSASCPKISNSKLPTRLRTDASSVGNILVKSEPVKAWELGLGCCKSDHQVFLQVQLYCDRLYLVQMILVP